MKKIDLILISFLFIISLLLRLYKINIPLADFHSWRQADTAAVTKNLLRNNFDLLHPQYDDLSSIQSGLENPNGYRMVEFPVYNAITAIILKLTPQLKVEVASRLVSIFFSLITILVLYYLGVNEVNRLVGFFAGFIYGVMPFFVFYSRIVLPEPTAVGLFMISIFFFYISLKKKKIFQNIFLFLSMIFFTLSLLTKPTIIFYSLVFIYLFYKKNGIIFLKNFDIYLYFILSTLPLIFWRLYILNYPEGIPANDWLITSINTSEGLKKIFFRPAFFRWIFFERINNLILGGYLLPLFILGSIINLKKNLLFLFFNLAVFSYLFIFQGGNVQHEYYQIIILPVIALNTGLGINFLIKNNKFLFGEKITAIALISVLIIFSFYFSYDQIKHHYSYPEDLIIIANITKKFTQPNDKIVTDRNGDTTLLFLMERRGAPAVYKEPQELKKLNYQYLVTQNMEYFNNLKKDFPVVFEAKNFGIIKL